MTARERAVNQSVLGNRLTVELGCDYPIFGLSHHPVVAAEITVSGGVGIWAAARLLPEEITEGLALIRGRVGHRPFGINLMLPHGVPERADRNAVEVEIPVEHRRFVDALYDKYAVPRDGLPGERNRIVRSVELFHAQIDAAVAGDAEVFAVAVGSDPQAASLARGKGMHVAALVGSPRHMPAAQAMRPDLIVAQGYDAGGHTGTVGTFSLVPKIVEMAGNTPVLCAGGVGTGAHVAAALALGAAGVWTGTLWLGTDEFNMPAPLLRKVLAAGCEDTVITRGSSGKPMRQIRTAWSDEWAAADAPAPLPMPWQDHLVGSLEGAAARHGIEALQYTPAGQSVEWIRARDTVANTVTRLVHEAEMSLARMPCRHGPGCAHAHRPDQSDKRDAPDTPRPALEPVTKEVRA